MTDEGDEPETRPEEIIDPASGKPRLCARRCDTCVAYPDDRMRLGEERRTSFLADAAAKDSYVVCHATIYPADPADYAPAICRGFWQLHRRDSAPTRFMLAFGHYVEVEPPPDR
jgi:hypothetical protein